ncbi:unnamed protein product [Auanema sp. JU1783]|nr:unnamed protein product [Auanema sp. JU1783]
MFKISTLLGRIIPLTTTKLPKKSVVLLRNLALGSGMSTIAVSLFAPSVSEKESLAEKPRRPKDLNLVLRETDALYDNYLIDNAYGLLARYKNSDCSELLWRLARVLCEKGKLSRDPAEKKKLMYEAYEVVQNALKHEPIEGCFGAHKWYAILLDYIGEIEGNKSRIEKSYLVREHLENAVKLYDKDATTWHILGIWHFSFADMGYATRLVAKTIFGTPPSSTYEEALHYFLKAEEIESGFYSTNTFYIAEVYDRLGKKEEATEYYKKAFKMPVVTADDNIIHKKAFDKLRKLGIKERELV